MRHSMLLRVALTLGALIGAGWGLFAVVGPTSADIVAGQYSMELTSSATTVPVGSTFVITAGVVHDDTVGPYSALQWQVQYDPTVVTFASFALHAGAPAGFCTTKSDSPPTQLLGCLDIGATLSGTSTITYSGGVWDSTYTCTTNGVVDFTLLKTDSTMSPKTFVKDIAINRPIHAHNVSVTCGTGAVPTSTFTPAATSTNTPAPTSTNTPAPTSTNTPAPTSTNTPAPTSTNTPAPTSTNTPGPTSTNTPAPTSTNTPAPTSTNTPGPTSTNTPAPTSTNTPAPTSTNTPAPTSTNTPAPTSTNTPGPTSTNTPAPTSTNTPLATSTNTPAPTSTNTPVATSTNTATATDTPVAESTNTPEATSTHTPVATSTNTATATETSVAASTNTPEATSTPGGACMTLGQKVRTIIGILFHFNAHEGQRGYSSRLDVNNDGVINLQDIIAVLDAPLCQHGHGRG